ncbi:MAG: shikimate kinase [Bacteroidota bacterium]
MLVYLIGFMGVGKTTLGKRIANKLSFEFIDLDNYIENKYKQTIPDIFETKGEAYFRKIELECITELSELKNHVISLGGGTPCYNDVMKLLKKTGVTIYMQANAAFLESRLKNSKQDRPLLKYLTNDSLRKYIDDKLAERSPYYLQADVVVDVLNADIEMLSKIIIDMQHRYPN